MPFVAEQLHQYGTCNVESFGHLGVHRGVVLHLTTGNILQTMTNATCRDDECWEHDEDNKGEAPLEGCHRGQGGDEHDYVAND